MCIKNLPFIFKEQHKDDEGRYILVCGTLYGQDLVLLNVYAPNTDCPKFMTNIITLFIQYNTDFGIIAGDFNCCMDACLDKSSACVSNPNASKTLMTASREVGLADVWREFNPLQKNYTFYSARHKTYSRLDLFFLPQAYLSSVTSCNIGTILISDHAPIYLRLSLHQHQIHSTRYWKFNSSLLTDADACKNIRHWLEQYRQDNAASPVSPAVIWEAAKAVIRGHLISYTSRRKRNMNEQCEQLNKELIYLEQLHKQSPTEVNLRNINIVRNKLNLLEIEHAKKLLTFTRQHHYEFGNKSSRLLAYQLRRDHADRTIKCIRNSSGQLKYDMQSIKSSFHGFYTQLYTSENPSETDINVFLENISLPSLSGADREKLNSFFTPEEVYQAILSLPSGKSPGLDGYPVEFYKVFWPEIEPLFMPMIVDFAQTGILPETMRTAVISLIHKKDKDAADCASFRPISLLPVDFKIISKLIAHRLEDLMPQLINIDQSGFIKKRNASDNIRRLLNVIDHSTRYKNPALVISLDAEKAFDRVEWSYLFSVLKKFNFGDRCIGWIKSMYSDPQAQICVNGTLTEKFDLQRGCRQGCPLSPFLFNLAIEPLAEAVRNNVEITGVDTGKIKNKISLYADDIILYLSNPENTVPKVLDLISMFGKISGYKINLTKSNALSLNMSISNSLKSSLPFTWAEAGLKYLGVKVSSDLKDLFNLNYPPLLKKIKEDLDYWKLLPISLLGRINTIKMNILPRLSFLFQSLPCYLHKAFFDSLNKLISSFVWKNSTPRISFKTLIRAKENGGLGLPDLQLYYWAAQTKGMISWIHLDCRTAHWTGIEEELCSPTPLTFLPYINNISTLHSVTRSYVVYNILRAWKDVKRFCGSVGKISCLAPLFSNPDLPPALGKSLLLKWKDYGIYQFQHLFVNCSLKSFSDLILEFKIPKCEFFKYLQIRHLISTLDKAGRLSLERSRMEDVLIKQAKLKGIVSVIYGVLLDHHDSSLASLKIVWQKDLECTFDDDQWGIICKSVFTSFSCNKIIEQNYKCMHRIYYTPLRLSKMYPNVSPKCHRCESCIGSIMHIFWKCQKLEYFWKEVHDWTVKALETSLDFTPVLYLFGTEFDKTYDPVFVQRISVISYIAKKCVLLNWKQHESPIFHLFKLLLYDTLRLEQFTYYLRGRADVFGKIWASIIDL